MRVLLHAQPLTPYANFPILSRTTVTEMENEPPAAVQPKRLKLSSDGSYAERYRQPSRRNHHCASAVEGKVVVWGGRTSISWDWEIVAPVVEVFDAWSEHWEQWKTTGPPPPGLVAAACASVGEYLFVYGGDTTMNEPSECSSKLHRLNTRTLQWTVMSPQNSATESPMAKSGCSMAAIGDQLALLGGVGRSSNSPTQPGSSFIDDDDDRWTNEFHLYDLEEDKWISPVTTGERPPPCSSCSLTSIDHRRAVMFGGCMPLEDGIYMDDVYTVDVQSMVHWTKMNKPGGVPWPMRRSEHAACCLSYGQEYPKILVTGGVNDKDYIYGTGQKLEYIWILDVNNESWIKASDTPLWPCCSGSSATAVDLGRGVTEVVIFGGLVKHCRANGTISLKFGVHSLFQLCVDYILKNYTFYEPLLQQLLPIHVQTHIHQEKEKAWRVSCYKGSLLLHI